MEVWTNLNVHVVCSLEHIGTSACHAVSVVWCNCIPAWRYFSVVLF